MTKMLDPEELKNLNEWFVRSFDKWYRMYDKSALTVIEYSTDRVTVRVDTSGKLFLRSSERIPLIKRMEKLFDYPVTFRPPEYKVLIYKNDSSGPIIQAKEVNETWFLGFLNKFKVHTERSNKEPELVYT